MQIKFVNNYILLIKRSIDIACKQVMLFASFSHASGGLQDMT